MFVLGMLIWLVLIGVYLLVPLAVFLLAWFATARKRFRTAATLFGLTAWLVFAPALLVWINSPWKSTVVLQGHVVSSREGPALVEDLGDAIWISIAASAPIFLIPAACALFLRRRSGSVPLPAG